MGKDMKVTIKTIKCKVLALTNIRTVRSTLAYGKIIRKMEEDNFYFKMAH